MEHKGTQTILTERLLLRKFNEEDAEMMYYNWASDERVTKFLPWTPYQNMEHVRLFISSMTDSYERNDFYHWIITFDGLPVGSISVTFIDEANHLCELGYCIGFEYWNKGITSEAMNAVISFLFNEAGFHRIYAKHDVENNASGKVMQKCGMTYEGTLRKHYKRHDGTYSDSKIYGILIDD